MKKYLALVVAFCSVSAMFAQTLPQEKKQVMTKIESALLSTGKIIIKEIYRVGGQIPRVSLEAVALTEPNGANTKVSGFEIEVSEYYNSQIIKTGTSFIDLDEVESTIESLGSIIDLAEKWKTVGKIAEVRYSTKGYSIFGFSQTGLKQDAFVYCGLVGTKIEIKDLTTIKKVIEKGYSLIK